MNFKLTTKDKSLMKNKAVRKWLKDCEKKMQPEVDRKMKELMIFGFTKI